MYNYTKINEELTYLLCLGSKGEAVEKYIDESNKINGGLNEEGHYDYEKGYLCQDYFYSYVRERSYYKAFLIIYYTEKLLNNNHQAKIIVDTFLQSYIDDFDFYSFSGTLDNFIFQLDTFRKIYNCYSGCVAFEKTFYYLLSHILDLSYTPENTTIKKVLDGLMSVIHTSLDFEMKNLAKTIQQILYSNIITEPKSTSSTCNQYNNIPNNYQVSKNDNFITQSSAQKNPVSNTKTSFEHTEVSQPRAYNSNNSQSTSGNNHSFFKIVFVAVIILFLFKSCGSDSNNGPRRLRCYVCGAPAKYAVDVDIPIDERFDIGRSETHTMYVCEEHR